jgi:hypothetical protein
MAVFRDLTGRRGAAVKLASVVGGVVATAALGVFLVSVFPAPWTRRGAAAPEPAPPPRAGAAPARPLESRAREAEYRKEEQRLRSIEGGRHPPPNRCSLLSSSTGTPRACARSSSTPINSPM